MYRIGIDLGGTNIVAGVVDDEFRIVATAKCKTRIPRPAEEIVVDMARMAQEAVQNAGLTMADIAYVGVGSPGTCNADTGIVEYSNNLQFEKLPLRDIDVYKRQAPAPRWCKETGTGRPRTACRFQ